MSDEPVCDGCGQPEDDNDKNPLVDFHGVGMFHIEECFRKALDDNHERKTMSKIKADLA